MPDSAVAGHVGCPGFSEHGLQIVGVHVRGVKIVLGLQKQMCSAALYFKQPAAHPAQPLPPGNTHLQPQHTGAPSASAQTPPTPQLKNWGCRTTTTEPCSPS